MPGQRQTDPATKRTGVEFNQIQYLSQIINIYRVVVLFILYIQDDISHGTEGQGQISHFHIYYSFFFFFIFFYFLLVFLRIRCLFVSFCTKQQNLYTQIKDNNINITSTLASIIYFILNSFFYKLTILLWVKFI